MRLTKKLNLTSLLNLPQAINNFVKESNTSLNHELVAKSTMQNILLGLEGKAKHDTWVTDNLEMYCLGRTDRDADGKLVYTLYQIWIEPKYRTGRLVRRILKFLKFYAQKQRYERLYVISSRLDKIKAYSRGLGKQFKVQTVNFSQDL